MKKIDYHKDWVFICSAFICFLLWIFWGWKLNFQTTDDRILTEIASGRMTGTPEAHLIYIMFPLGLVLKILYLICPNMNWYANILLLLQSCAVFIMLYYIVKSCKRKTTKILSVLLLLGTIMGMWIYSLTTFTYTTVAAVIGVAMIFVLYLEKNLKRQCIEVVILSFFCLNLRKDIFLMFIPIMIIGVFYNWFVYNEKKYLILIVCVGIMSMLSIFADNMAYNSESWQSYKRYNESRTKYFDYYYDVLSNYDQNKEMYEKLQITENDLKIINQYDMQLKNQELYEKIEKIIEEYSDNKNIKEKIMDASTCFVNKVVKECDKLCFLVFLLWGILIIFTVYLGNKKALLNEVFTLIVCIMFWGYLAYRQRILPRVTFSVLLLQVLYPQIMMVREISDKIYLCKKKIFMIILSVLILFCGYFGYKNTRYLRPSNEVLSCDDTYDELRKYCNSREDCFFFLDVFSVVDCNVTFTLTADNRFDHFISLGDWYANSPLYNKKLVHIKMKDVQRAIIENEKVCLIGGENTDWSILQELYGDNIFLKEIDRIGNNNNLIIYEVKRK